MQEILMCPNKSTHICPIFNFDFNDTKQHYNAEKVRVWELPDSSWTYICSIYEWQNFNGKVVWIPPDSLVDTTRPEFNFLAKDAKFKNEKGENDKQGKYVLIKAKKLRGIVSYGLLVKYNGSLDLNGDAAQELGCIHYEPPVKIENGKKVNTSDAQPPEGFYVTYDVDAAAKYASKIFSENELVYVTRKYHGMSFRCNYKNGKFNVSSHYNWKNEFEEAPQITVEELVNKGVEESRAKEIYERKVVNFVPKRSFWWEAFYATENLADWCKKNEGYTLYGELINSQGGFNYGLPNGVMKVVAFDILQPNGKFMDFVDFLRSCEMNGVKTVDIIHHYFPYNFKKLVEVCEGLNFPDSKLEEGIVIGSLTERWEKSCGRCKFKIINPKYLECSN